MALRQQGRLFMRGHGDCFIHATTSWLNYSNFTLSEDPLVVVRMIYTTGDGEKDLLVTLSPVPIPYENVAKGVNHRKYLEIDLKLATELGIKPDTLVVLESVREVEECDTLTLAPVIPSDYDKLVNNSEKIEHELADRIRVVSCSSFTFPIWINNFTVPVKVVRTEPSAKWVKLMPDRTRLELCESHLQPSSINTSSTSMQTPNSDQLSSTSPSDSDEKSTSSKQTTSSITTWNFPNSYQTHSRSRIASSNASTTSSVDPDSNSDQLNFSFTSFFESAKRYLPLFTQAQARACAPQQDGLITPEEPDDIDEQVPNSQVKHTLGPPIELSDVSKVPLTELQPPAMKKQNRQLLNEIKDKVPVIDPPTKRSLKQRGNAPISRTMPPIHYSGGSHYGSSKADNKLSVSSIPRKSSSSAGNEEKAVKPQHRRSNTWDPSSSFGIKRELSVSPRLNICVRVQPHALQGMSGKIEIRTAWSEKNGLWKHERAFDIFVNPSTIPEVYNFTSTHNLKRKAILVELIPIEYEMIQQQEATATDYDDLDRYSLKARQTPQAKPPESVLLPKSLVVRLFFATKLQIRSGKLEPSVHDCNQERNKEKSEFGDVQEEVLVQVGHVVLSDAVRQQLRIKMCSRVELCGIREENRIAYNSKAKGIVLQPIADKGVTVDIVDVKKRFADWVSELSEVDIVGCALVDKQIVPLFTNKGEPVNARISVRNAPTKKPGDSAVSYYLLRPSDVSRSIIGVEPQSKEITTMEKLSDIKELNQTVIEETPDHFGALNVPLEEGRQYIDRVFFEPRKSGIMLICGSQGSSGAGCGKTSLAKILCKGASGHPYYANVSIVGCTFMRGQSTHRVKKRLRGYFREAVLHQPSVLLLDDLDHCVPVFEDAQELVGEEGTASIKKAQVLLDLVHEVRTKDDHVLIIVTAQSKQTLNKLLMQSRGEHIFNKCIEIGPPNLADRVAIIKAILKSKNLLKLYDSQLRKIALRTEGFQSSDLATLVDRAISKSELRTICPTSPPSFASWNRLSTESFDSESLDLLTASSPSAVTLTGSPPKFPSSWKKSKTKLPIEATKSNDLSPQLDSFKRSKKISIDSTATIKPEYSIDEFTGRVCRVPELHKVNSLSKMELTPHDFYAALEGFVPVSLRGLPLHSSGTIDFSHVGGMMDAKKTLTETLFWPSKYPKLFSQCPIRQRCGVLLYGAPGTGKTLLAGAVAKEFGLNFVSIKGPELLSKYIGASEQAVRDIFSRALSAKPCILFFDEFDSLAPRRGHDNTGVTDRVVNQLLTQLDGVEALQGVYVLAASSRPDLIDPALLRPGRIDRNLFCAMPEETDRLGILKAQKKSVPLDPSVDLKTIAEKSVGFTGADLKALLYNAQLKAAHKALGRMNLTREQSPDVEMVSRSSSQSDASGALDTSGIGSSLMSSYKKRRRPLVFKSSASGIVEHTQLTHALESKVTVLHEKQRQRTSTLTSDHSLKLKLKDEPDRPTARGSDRGATITQEDLLSALDEIKPSVSEKERKKYDQIYEKFIGKTKETVADIKPTATMA